MAAKLHEEHFIRQDQLAKMKEDHLIKESQECKHRPHINKVSCDMNRPHSPDQFYKNILESAKIYEVKKRMRLEEQENYYKKVNTGKPELL